MKQKIAELFQFLFHDIWQIRVSTLPSRQAFLFRFIKLILSIINRYAQGQIALRASALTFYSLMSIVPILAIAFGVAQGFGLESPLKQELKNSLTTYPGLFDQIMAFVNNLLDNTKGEMIAGVGSVVLLWTVIRLLNNIEDAFNDIWGESSRHVVRKITDYLTIVFIAPIFIVLAGSVTIFVSSKIELYRESSTLINLISPFLFFLMKLTPYTLVWVLFIIIYWLMPNTKVNFMAAFIAGIIAGTGYQLLQWTFINFQIGISKYNAIYGSFFIIPMVFIWVQISWTVILFGAELSFAIQNWRDIDYSTDDSSLSINHIKFFSLAIIHLIVKRFVNEESPLSISEISEQLDISIRKTSFIIDRLLKCNILCQVKIDEKKEFAFLPGIDINRLSISFIINRVEDVGENLLHLFECEEHLKIKNSLKEVLNKFENSNDDLLIKDI